MSDCGEDEYRIYGFYEWRPALKPVIFVCIHAMQG